MLSHSSGQLCGLFQHLPQTGLGLGVSAVGGPGFLQQLWVSAQSFSLAERTLMLPLTEGSLRLRADDEDSLTSEDSFFSATEVISWGPELGWARPSGQH